MFSKFLFLFCFSLVPVFIWVSVYILLNSRSKTDSISVALIGVLFGSLAMFPVLTIQYLWVHYPELNFFLSLQQLLPSFAFYSVFFSFVSFLEEAFKALALILLIQYFYKSFDQIVDGIVFGAFVALGFAFAENMYYFMYIVEGFEMSMDFVAIFNLRSFGTMLSHTLFTGTFGVFYATAYFAAFAKPEKYTLRRLLEMRFFRTFCLKKKKQRKEVYRYLVIAEGFFFAFLLHLIFNMLVKLTIFGIPAVYFTVPFLMIVSLWLWSSFFKKEFYKMLPIKTV